MESECRICGGPVPLDVVDWTGHDGSRFVAAERSIVCAECAVQRRGNSVVVATGRRVHAKGVRRSRTDLSRSRSHR